jgi:hypothetical protein
MPRLVSRLQDWSEHLKTDEAMPMLDDVCTASRAANDQQRAALRAMVRETPLVCDHLLEPYLTWLATERGRSDFTNVLEAALAAVSITGGFGDSRDTLLRLDSLWTHNHPEGVRGAQAAAVAVYLARTGSGKPAIRQQVEQLFGYDLSTPLSEVRETYEFDLSCRGSVPQSIVAFLEARRIETRRRRVKMANLTKKQMLQPAAPSDEEDGHNRRDQQYSQPRQHRDH